VSGEAALRRWAESAARPTAGGTSPPRGAAVAAALAEGVLKANADGAAGLLDGGLEAKLKPAEDVVEPNAAELAMEKAGAAVIEGGRAKEKPVDAEAEETVAGAVGGTAKGAGAEEEEEEAGGGAGGAAGAEMGRRAGKPAGPEERGAGGFRVGASPKPGKHERYH